MGSEAERISTDGLYERIEVVKNGFSVWRHKTKDLYLYATGANGLFSWHISNGYSFHEGVSNPIAMAPVISDLRCPFSEGTEWNVRLMFGWFAAGSQFKLNKISK